MLLALCGCVSVPSTQVTADRVDYGQVISESWKRQTLMNIVRLRYADAPVFLEINSVINSYTLGGTANAHATLPNGPRSSDVFDLGAAANWSNTPTVTYQPVIGDLFTKSLLQPIPPASVFQLLQGGWPVSFVFATVVGSVNGLRNTANGVVADPAFTELTERLNQIQRAGNIGIRIEAYKNGNAVVVVIPSRKNGDEVGEDGRRVRELLGLPVDSTEFEITYGLLPRQDREVAMLTRSMMEIMLQLGFGIDLPKDHAASGRVLPGQRQPGDAQAEPLVHIHSGTKAPADAYAAVPYKGHWFWIEDTDIASKRTFTFLLILFSLAQTGQPASSPVVTVPSR